MDWLIALNFGFSAVAILLSGVALAMARKDRRLDAYSQVEGYLLSEPLQAARRQIYEAKQRGRLPSEEAAFQAILLGLGAFNTCARWARRGLLPQTWVVEEWHHHLRDMRQVYESVLAVRATWHSYNPWPDLDSLLGAAEDYCGLRACCSGPTLEERAASAQITLLTRDNEQPSEDRTNL